MQPWIRQQNKSHSDVFIQLKLLKLKIKLSKLYIKTLNGTMGLLGKSKPAPPVSTAANTPVSNAPVSNVPVSNAPVPMAVPAGGVGKKLKDVTLRPIVLELSKELTIGPAQNGNKILLPQVSSTQFNNYMHVLKIMAQLSRIVYCDLSVIREVVVMSEVFGKDDTNAVNDVITLLDKQYSSKRRTSVNPPVNPEGRPMQSYADPPCGSSQPDGPEIVTYVSSPGDVTFMMVGGNQLRLKSKLEFFKETDLAISFKGSSTMNNFKHDLYSQFDATELNDLVKPLQLTDPQVGKVTGAFVKSLMKIWPTIKREIIAKKPTRLFITGHSMGGAHATLLAFIIAECHASQFAYEYGKKLESVHLITFGAPTCLSDTARNNFNRFLEDGFLTLDRVVSQAKSLVIDAIPSIPVGFSHPGYQPLKMEWKPEENTGRAYQLKNIQRVFINPATISQQPVQKPVPTSVVVNTATTNTAPAPAAAQPVSVAPVAQHVSVAQGGKTRNRNRNRNGNRTQKGGVFWAGEQKKKYEDATILRMPTKIMIDATNPFTQVFPHAEYWLTYLGGLRMAGMKNPSYKGKTFVGRVYQSCISYKYEPADPTDVPPPDANDNTTFAPAAAKGGRTRKHRKGRKCKKVTRRRGNKRH